jgi:hypothetical protein
MIQAEFPVGWYFIEGVSSEVAAQLAAGLMPMSDTSHVWAVSAGDGSGSSAPNHGWGESDAIVAARAFRGVLDETPREQWTFAAVNDVFEKSLEIPDAAWHWPALPMRQGELFSDDLCWSTPSSQHLRATALASHLAGADAKLTRKVCRALAVALRNGTLVPVRKSTDFDVGHGPVLDTEKTMSWLRCELPARVADSGRPTEEEWRVITSAAHKDRAPRLVAAVSTWRERCAGNPSVGSAAKGKEWLATSAWKHLSDRARHAIALVALLGD